METDFLGRKMKKTVNFLRFFRAKNVRKNGNFLKQINYNVQ